MYAILVEETSSNNHEVIFDVVVARGDNEHVYEVTLPILYFKKVAKNKCTEAEFIKKSFRFLLDKEPPDSIVPSFYIPKIEEYFPAFAQEVMRF